MTGKKDQFVTLEIKEGGVITFGDNGKGHIIGFGKIQITPSTFIENILYVKGLRHNLISISQVYDIGYKVSFESLLCIVTNLLDNSIIFINNRQGNIYMIDLNEVSINNHCLVAIQTNINETSWIWHRRLGRASTNLITKLLKHNLVKEISNLSFENDKICDACQLGKQTKNTFKSKNIVSTTRPLELLHIVLFGPTRTTSLGGKSMG